jgi:hypothetical protein
MTPVDGGQAWVTGSRMTLDYGSARVNERLNTASRSIAPARSPCSPATAGRSPGAYTLSRRPAPGGTDGIHLQARTPRRDTSRAAGRDTEQTVLRRGGLAYGDGDAAIPTPSNRKRRTRCRYKQLADRAGASPGEHGAGAAQSALSPEATIMRCGSGRVHSPSGLLSRPVGREGPAPRSPSAHKRRAH